MPYQLSFNTRKRIFNEVRLITAGDDKFNLCGSRVYLLAEVEGNLAGHTVEWEQDTGTGVTIENRFNLNPYYDEVDTTDKSFTIYIDRGTIYEQKASVNIWATPRAIASSSFDFSGNAVQTRDILDVLPVECDSIEAFVNVSVGPPSSTHGVESGVNIVVEVTWDHPGDPVKDLHIEQYRVLHNGSEVALYPPAPLPLAGESLGNGEGPPSAVPLLYSGTLGVYRIDTYYNISGKHYVRESCEKDFSNLIIPSVDAYNDAIDGVSFNSSATGISFNRINFENIFLKEESLANSSVDITSSSVAFNRTNYSALFLNFDGMASTSFSGSDTLINITRYGGGGIGGGS